MTAKDKIKQYLLNNFSRVFCNTCRNDHCFGICNGCRPYAMSWQLSSEEAERLTEDIFSMLNEN